MSLRPFFSADPWEDFSGPLQLFDQNFGHGLDMSDLLQPTLPFNFGYFRPWRHVSRANSGMSSVEMGKDGFKMSMDVRHFKPEEISVKQVDNTVVVEGKHEEMPDEHGFVSRHFVRRYVLPKGVDATALSSSLSSDGVLMVTAPKTESKVDGSSRTIQIEQTGKPAIQNGEKAGN